MKTILIMVLFLTTLASQAQTNYNPKLLKGFTEQELNSKSAEDIAFLSFYVDHSYYIGKYEAAKSKNNKIAELDVPDLKNINIYQFGLKADEEQPSYYHISGTDKLLVLYSMKQVRSLYQTQRNK